VVHPTRLMGGGAVEMRRRRTMWPLPIHLEVNVPDREAELERVLELGAKLVETRSRSVGGAVGKTWTVMRDPEWNPFCLD